MRQPSNRCTAVTTPSQCGVDAEPSQRYWQHQSEVRGLSELPRSGNGPISAASTGNGAGRTLGVVGIAVLGPVSVEGDAAVLAPRDRVVLAALALRPGDVTASEHLADAL
jgi:hypothetical protein